MTTAPRTLLQIAGATARPPALAQAALVVIDAQNEYVDGRLPLDGVGPAVAAIARLLDLARGQGVPVFHILHQGSPGGALFDPTSPAAAIIPAAAPRSAEPVIAKRLPNAFAGTDLEERLRATGRSGLILAGFMTHMCVAATARAALDLGFASAVVAAATATRDLPDPLGGVVPAAAVQRAALASLADRFAVVVADETALTVAREG
ncbi:isochorismatase family protein [Azospirillum sp. RWY-5-1]|uniref:Isochorismatase family protein n=1 Tax=Azospirillum oleiclasticum TaxID=2735135 RepID=A0ABX2TJG5_9PROT|nr:isochorismatase family protein [Azospirillum oleiclasticum]NYZ17142.1 isochorismatase family protein [Azospirillum oleiclasticum]NYZ24279.1 isochorismatase family protein [Azospirillum oleiclasticum]